MPETEQKTIVEVASKANIEPLDKSEIRQLIDARHKMREVAGISGSQLSNRDVLEYSYARNIGYVLENAANSVLKLWSDGAYFRMAAELLTKENIEESRSKGLLGGRQLEALAKAEQSWLDDIDHFNDWLETHGETDIRSDLGDNFKNISEDKYKIDVKSFPGVVTLLVTDEETFSELANQRGANGLYSPGWGEGELKGRIIAINASKVQGSDSKTQLHEYYHFLFAKLEPYFEILPEVSSRRKRHYREEKLEVKHKIEKELEIVPRTDRELIEQGKLEIDESRDKPSYAFAEETEFGKYPEGNIRKAFDNFRTEFLSWSESGKWQANVAKYFGTKLDGAKLDVYWPTFRQETILVKGMLEEVRKREVSPREIEYLVAGARNMQQVAKNLYLHLQARTWL